ncbi:MAG: magnesium chelatase subunit H, partial [Pseudomonadota bacterium]
MTPKRTLPAEQGPAPRVPVSLVIITLDRHLNGTVEDARAAIQEQVPGARIHLHVATNWDQHPEQLAAAKADIAGADFIIANMLFMEDHINAVLPDIAARRPHCDAVLGLIAAGEVIKQTRLGRFDMGQPDGTVMGLLKILRGGAKKGVIDPDAPPKRGTLQADDHAPSGGSSGAGQMAMLRRLPKILRFIPGKAQDVRAYFLAMQYWLAGSNDNLAALCLFLMDRYAGGERSELRGALTVPEPIIYPDVGVYHPRMAARLSETLSDLPGFDTGFEARSDTRAGTPAATQSGRQSKAPPTVGLLIMRSYLLADDCAHYDAVIEAYEARGVRVIPAFAGGLDARPAIEQFFLDQDGVPGVDAVVSLTGFSLVGGPAYNDAAAAQAILAKLDVPYVAAHALEFQSLSTWREGQRGLMPVEATMMVALPELDGAVLPTVFGGRAAVGADHGHAVPEPTARAALSKQTGTMGPDHAQIEQLVRRTSKLMALRRTPVAERTVACVIFNFPPNAGATGTAAFLDVFASLHATMRRLRAEGYTIDVPDSVDDLRAAVLQGNAADYGADANVAATVPVADHVAHTPWLEEIEAQWGPAPGRHNTDGRSLQILGRQFGNLFVGVQPAFGYEGDPMRLLFEGNFAPTHAFSAFYRYLDAELRADAVLHFGTHGALEFMPGKQTGMGAECWPQRLIGDLPHFYLYAANNPSEATIAKRRAGAALISYLTPPVVQAGLYKGLAELKASLDRWRTGGQDNAHSRQQLGELIIEQAAALDLDVPATASAALLSDDAVARLAQALLELEYTLIPHGLHVVGQPMARAEKTSLFAAIEETRAGDDETSAIVPMAALVQVADGANVEAAASAALQGSRKLDKKAHAALTARLGVLAKLNADLESDGELAGIVQALNGGYLKPVHGGDLLRSTDIAPAGRNIHAFDPFRLPTAFAVRDGAAQADRLLTRYIDDCGALPETVALVLWG